MVPNVCLKEKQQQTWIAQGHGQVEPKNSYQTQNLTNLKMQR